MQPSCDIAIGTFFLCAVRLTDSEALFNNVENESDFFIVQK